MVSKHPSGRPRHLQKVVYGKTVERLWLWFALQRPTECRQRSNRGKARVWTNKGGGVVTTSIPTLIYEGLGRESQSYKMAPLWKSQGGLELSPNTKPKKIVDKFSTPLHSVFFSLGVLLRQGHHRSPCFVLRATAVGSPTRSHCWCGCHGWRMLISRVDGEPQISPWLERVWYLMLEREVWKLRLRRDYNL